MDLPIRLSTTVQCLQSARVLLPKSYMMCFLKTEIKILNILDHVIKVSSSQKWAEHNPHSVVWNHHVPFMGIILYYINFFFHPHSLNYSQGPESQPLQYSLPNVVLWISFYTFIKYMQISEKEMLFYVCILLVFF